MNRTILITAAALGIIAIALGAFGAHGLKQLISVEAQQTFETGVRYQMYHALLLLFVGSTTLIKAKSKTIIYYLVVVGVLFFSGSIYGLATMDVTNINFKSIGFITPLGGLLLLTAWVIMMVGFFKEKRYNS
ncbi:DUF423 domain-containing protein [Gelidibacter salicanalis]|uniref:DUF423 domain-containing protein n=1 Tax=Gelidibacter salicanalis TaxID=291193 RepID=A0A5C7AJX0_9FLAO|nr:DUF423 domain-containing protein [Gelidibacter salicanalis]TXE09016.1 DUF423 domain-containing protein [Gelidibacter salicanalis]